MKDKDIITAYTIARAISFGMNITFAKNGYKYSGTLKNNTNISGKLESMNVWYKYLGSTGICVGTDQVCHKKTVLQSCNC